MYVSILQLQLESRVKKFGQEQSKMDKKFVTSIKLNVT